MTKVTLVCLGADNPKAIFSGIKEWPTEKVIVLVPEGHAQAAREAKAALGKFDMDAEIFSIKGDLWEGVFRMVGELNAAHPNMLVNVGATRDPSLQCMVTCAAFVNGVRAFGVGPDGAIMPLPVLKFSYYRLLTEKKLALLRVMDNPECCASLNELSRKTGMSLPLVSYHINGNHKSEGLVSLGLAETRGKRKSISVFLTPLGRMLVRGYVQPPKEDSAR